MSTGTKEIKNLDSEETSDVKLTCFSQILSFCLKETWRWQNEWASHSTIKNAVEIETIIGFIASICNV